MLLANNSKKKDIAAAIKVSLSTITRELKRNSSRSGVYNWETAQKSSVYKKHRHPGNRSILQQIEDEAINLLTAKQW
ncbi:MAG: IS30 family transposase, partial [Prevotellaceae bacterium]|nr:IS30 family transposase [Prevotellaceae bacterium]